MFYSFYVLELIRGIGTLCDSLKLDLLLHITDTHSNLDLRGAGGAIFADILGNRHQLDETLAAGIPCVVVNHIVEDRKVSCISIDNTGGAEAAVDYLASLGHKKIAHIAGDFVAQSAQERLQGYKKSLEKNQLPFRQEYVFKTDYSRGQARQAAEKLLNMQEPPSAVFIASDSMALEVMAVAKEAGKDIPRDLSVVGFDDNPSGLYGPVALTTVRQPLLKMAQEAVGQLKAIMGAEDKTLKPKRIILPAELVIRESCRPLGD
jgi:DNA-binding LacI/PurR family transcriptional regulator